MVMKNNIMMGAERGGGLGIRDGERKAVDERRAEEGVEIGFVLHEGKESE